MTRAFVIDDDVVGAHTLRLRLARHRGAGISELRVRAGSRIRPVVSLDLPLADDAAARASTALGASILAWEGSDEWSAWQRCLAPLDAAPLAGRPDPARPWALLDEADARALPSDREAREQPWQWHILVRHRAHLPDHVVQWSMRPAIAAPLLGACEAVLVASRAPDSSPLACDAWRLGRPVLALAEGHDLSHARELAVPTISARLAHSLSPAMLELPRIWESILDDVRAGTLTPVMSAERARRAREHAARARSGRLGAAMRGLSRLGTAPREALRDARLWAARKLWSSARAPASR
jgi:hypothetical protein